MGWEDLFAMQHANSDGRFFINHKTMVINIQNAAHLKYPTNESG
jgi:hypothetical protein